MLGQLSSWKELPMAVGSVLAFWGVATLLIVVPGADWAFMIGAVVRDRPMAAAVGGITIGYTAMTAVVAAGIGALLAGTPAFLRTLTLIGSAYLLWLGVKTLRKPPGSLAPTVDDTSPPTGRATLLSGIGVSGLNPKALLLFLALLPQFADPHWSWPLAVQLALLGLIFTATCAIFYTGMSVFARTLVRARPRAARAVGYISGAGMVLIGLSLLIEQFLH
ncbi:LysE family translocator [Nocardia sp. NPDC049707]|uniref:LysE family translocator n=1 Tax=Nocardia sp. NPDC049707 TaxID=3154735 RepID=UPI00342793F7